jgi:hypothetical protein
MYMKLRYLLLSLFLLASFAASSQIIIYPNSGIYGVGYNRIVPLNTLWLPTGCGVPFGTASLNAPGNNPRQSAIFTDTCGHHIYWYEPNTSTWARIDTGGGGGGSGTVTAIVVSNDSLYYTTSSGNTFVVQIVEQADSTVLYVTPTQLYAAINSATTLTVNRGLHPVGSNRFVLGDPSVGATEDSSVYFDLGNTASSTTNSHTWDSVGSGLKIKGLPAGTGTPAVIVHMPDSSLAQMPYPSGGSQTLQQVFNQQNAAVLTVSDTINTATNSVPLTIEGNMRFAAPNGSYSFGDLAHVANQFYVRNLTSDGNIGINPCSTCPLNLTFNGVLKGYFNYTGQWNWGYYLATTSFPVTAVGMLVFDASGNIGTAPIGGGGSVTSVGMSIPTTLLTLSGSPVTSSGTFAVSLATQSANTAFGNFTGSTAVPTFGKLPLAAMATNTANTLTGYDASGNPVDVTAGTNVNINAGVISATGSGGLASVYGIGQVGVKGTDSVYKTDSVWFRGPIYNNTGIVIAGNPLNNLGEPSPAYDTAQVISTSLPVVRILYTDDTAGVGQQNYAESIDGAPGTWSIVYDVIPGHYRGCMVKNGGYYMYFGVNTAETQVDVYESPHGAPGSWTLQNSAVITASSLGATNIYNSWVYINQVTGTWYMLLDVGSVEYGFSDYGLTSTDGHGVTWTAVTGNPVLPRLAAPWFTYYGGKYYCWGLSSMTNAILPSDLYEYSATNFTGPWAMVQTGSILHRLTSLEGVTGIIGQVADPALVSLQDSSTLLLAAVTANGNGSGGSQIAAYRSPLSITKLITTSSEQNAPFTPEWEQFNGGNIAYNNGNVGIGINTPVWPLQIGENPGNYIQGYPGVSAEYARNFISSTSFGNTIFGYNLYEGAYGGWQLADSAANGYAFNLTSSGITTYYAAGGAGHTIPLPLNLGSWKYASANTTSVFTLGAAAGVANGRLLFNGNPDDGSGASIQCIIGSLSAEFGNITTGTINTDYLGIGNAGAGNLGIGPTKAFAASSTGTTNLAVLASLSLCSSCAGNTAIGAASAAGMTTGDYNTFIGSNSATSGTLTGNFNTSAGRGSLQNLAGGTGNAALGASAGGSATSSSYTLSLGDNAGNSDGTITTPGTISGFSAIGDSTQVLIPNAISIGGEYSTMKYVGIDNPVPLAWFEVPTGTGVTGQAGFKFFYASLPTTAASGTGTVATITFSPQQFVPFHPGQWVVISGMTPSGYNATVQITACTLTTITYFNTTTGAQTGAGTIAPTGKPGTNDYWTLGPSADTLWWEGASGTKYALNFPSSTTPTLQQVITVGATLTGTNVISLGTSSLAFSGSGSTVSFQGLTSVNLIYGNSIGPSISAGTGAGTSPTVSVTGTNTDGIVTATIGTLPSGSSAAIVTLTLAGSTTTPNGMIVTLTPYDATTALLTGATMVFARQTAGSATTSWSIYSGTTALTPATTYNWQYHVMGY